MLPEAVVICLSRIIQRSDGLGDDGKSLGWSGWAVGVHVSVHILGWAVGVHVSVHILGLGGGLSWGWHSWLWATLGCMSLEMLAQCAHEKESDSASPFGMGAVFVHTSRGCVPVLVRMCVATCM